jgi:hypothetical protein
MKKLKNTTEYSFLKSFKLKSQEKIIKIADDINIKVSSIPDLAFHDVKNFFISKISTVPLY